MDEESEDEEPQAIVVDHGSGKVRSGFAGDDAPRVVFQSTVGRSLYQKRMTGLSEQQVFIGDGAMSKSGILDLKYPINHGIVTSWDDLELVWHHMYKTLRIQPEEYRVLMSKHLRSSKDQGQKKAQILFETFLVPATFLEPDALSAMYASGRNTGFVLDIGYGVTSTCAFRLPYACPTAIYRQNFGGCDLDEYLKKLLTERGHYFNSSADMEDVRDIKEKLGFVAMDYAETLADIENERKAAETSSDIEKQYELPDGEVITVGSERGRCPEVLFNPRLMGKVAKGIHQIVHDSIMKCPIDLRRDFWSNIILCGGTTMFDGLAERLQKELTASAPKSIKVKIVAPPERKYSVWIGGSIEASLSTFQKMWITKSDYDESGPSTVLRKNSGLYTACL